MQARENKPPRNEIDAVEDEFPLFQEVAKRGGGGRRGSDASIRSLGSNVSTGSQRRRAVFKTVGSRYMRQSDNTMPPPPVPAVVARGRTREVTSKARSQRPASPIRRGISPSSRLHNGSPRIVHAEPPTLVGFPARAKSVLEASGTRDHHYVPSFDRCLESFPASESLVFDGSASESLDRMWRTTKARVLMWHIAAARLKETFRRQKTKAESQLLMAVTELERHRDVAREQRIHSIRATCARQVESVLACELPQYQAWEQKGWFEEIMAHYTALAEAAQKAMHRLPVRNASIDSHAIETLLARSEILLAQIHASLDSYPTEKIHSVTMGLCSLDTTLQENSSCLVHSHDHLTHLKGMDAQERSLRVQCIHHARETVS